jgi:hypothetical protein
MCYKGKVFPLQAWCGPRVGRGIALLFHDRGTRRGWVVSSTSRPHFTPGKDSVPILQEAEWAPGPVWTGGISRPRRDSIPDRPVRSQSLYRLSYILFVLCIILLIIVGDIDLKKTQFTAQVSVSLFLVHFCTVKWQCSVRLTKSTAY